MRVENLRDGESLTQQLHYRVNLPESVTLKISPVV